MIWRACFYVSIKRENNDCYARSSQDNTIVLFARNFFEFTRWMKCRDPAIPCRYCPNRHTTTHNGRWQNERKRQWTPYNEVGNRHQSLSFTIVIIDVISSPRLTGPLHLPITFVGLYLYDALFSLRPKLKYSLSYCPSMSRPLDFSVKGPVPIYIHKKQKVLTGCSYIELKLQKHSKASFCFYFVFFLDR